MEAANNGTIHWTATLPPDWGDANSTVKLKSVIYANQSTTVARMLATVSMMEWNAGTETTFSGYTRRNFSVDSLIETTHSITATALLTAHPSVPVVVSTSYTPPASHSCNPDDLFTYSIQLTGNAGLGTTTGDVLLLDSWIEYVAEK